MCYRLHDDGDRQVILRHITVIPLTAEPLRPGHGRLIFCTSCNKKAQTSKLIPFTQFIYNCVCLLGLMPCDCYLQGTCRCLWCCSVVVSPQLWLKFSLQRTSCPLWRESDSRTYLSSGRPRHCSPGGNDFKILWNSVLIRYCPIGFYASLTSANTKPQSNG